MCGGHGRQGAAKTTIIYPLFGGHNYELQISKRYIVKYPDIIWIMSIQEYIKKRHSAYKQNKKNHQNRLDSLPYITLPITTQLKGKMTPKQTLNYAAAFIMPLMGLGRQWRDRITGEAPDSESGGLSVYIYIPQDARVWGTKWPWRVLFIVLISATWRSMI